MRVGQERIDSVPGLIEPESMGAGLRSNRFQSPHAVGLEHLDQPGFADGDVEMPAFGVEKDHIGNPGKLNLRQLRP